MEIQHEIRRTWLPRGFRFVIGGRARVKPETAKQLSLQCYQILVHSFPELVFSSKSSPSLVQNVKGRELGKNFEDLSLAMEDGEVLFLKGELHEGANSAEADEDLQFTTPISIKRYTKFDKFPSNSVINFEVHENRSSEFPPGETLDGILMNPQFELEQFRIGLSKYQAQSVFSLLGSSPAVVQTLSVDCSGAEFKFCVSVEQKERVTGESLREIPFFREFADLVLDGFGVCVLPPF